MSCAEDTVVIKNIYYMMAYAFKAIDIADFKRLEVESFGNVLDLLAAILAAGLDAQRRRGLEREYQPREEDLMRVRGRIDIADTMRLRMRQRQDLHCVFDERTEDTYKNQVLKTTALYLLRAPEVDAQRKRDLKRSLVLMQDVSLLDPQRIAWGSMRYHRNNRSYQILMNVCYLALHELLLRDERGEVRLADVLSGDSLHRLYEKFILEYYRKHWSWLHPAAREIDHGIGDSAPDFLPRMLTDVTLANGDKCLIIDAKCYGTILGTHYDKEILSPANLNQILSYVMHAANAFDGEVSGMLLYAKTEGTELESESWLELGHTYHVRTLDLNQDFAGIAAQLDAIAGLVG